MAKIPLSVIIPTYNRVELLKKCLHSLFNQTLPKHQYEIIIIDDGSTDNTQKILYQTAAEAPVSFKFFKHENKGPGAARNVGIKEAQGEIVFFTGDDIIATENLLKEHLDFHKKYHDVAVLGRIKWHPDIDVTDFMKYIMISGYQFGYEKIKDPMDLSYGYFYTSNISLPKSWFDKTGYFDEDFPYASFEDIELGYRMEKKGLRIIYNKGALAYHMHIVDLKSFCERQRKAGESGYIFYLKHPEIASTIGVGRSRLERNLRILFFRILSTIFKLVRFRKGYYSSQLLYFYSLGVKQRCLISPGNPGVK